MEPIRTYETVIHGQRVNVKVYPRGPVTQVTEPISCFARAVGGKGPSGRYLPQIDPTWFDDDTPAPRAPGRQRKLPVPSDALA